MSIYEADGLLLKGIVQRGYTIQTAPEVAYQYLSDIRTLLSQVPHVSKIQVGKNSGRTRAFFNMTVMAVAMDAVLDIEPIFDSQERIIRLKTAEQPLGPVPPGYVTGTFNALVRVQPLESGFSRVTSKIALAFDGAQLLERGLFSRTIIETTGATLLQEYCERLCDDYIINLLENFRKWRAERGV